jgi:hypothetical protein
MSVEIKEKFILIFFFFKTMTFYFIKEDVKMENPFHVYSGEPVKNIILYTTINKYYEFFKNLWKIRGN